MKIRRGDEVVVIAGDDSSNQPRRVVAIDRAKGLIVVEGVNQVYKHVRRGHPKSPQGGRLHVEMPISISNVRFHCSSCKKPQGVRLGYRYLEDGSKERYCRNCNASAGAVSGPRAAYAGK